VVKPVAAAPKPVAKPVATAPKPVAKPVVAPKPVVKPTPKPVEAVVVEEEGDEVADGAVADDDLDALLGD
jgi:outer membrane biosynthesis protein TonB